MKNYFLKGSAFLTVLAVFSMIALYSCKPDPDPDPIPVEDGLYIKGAATALDSLKGAGLMSKANNEVTQEPRASLYEMYIAIEGGSEGFSLVNVVGGVEETWGPGADFAKVLEDSLDNDEPKSGLWKGSYAINESVFTVEEDGLYHLVVDTELGLVAVAKVEWGLIGGATPGAWTDDTEMTESAFDLNTISFDVAEVVILENDFKFRYSGGWKIILDTELDLGVDPALYGVNVNTNFGGAVDALVAGGDNIANATYAVYAFNMTWTLADGFTATQTYVKDAEVLPEYPENLYMIGGGLNLADSDTDGTPDGWQWELTDYPMLHCGNGNNHVFWRIVYLEAGATDVADDAGIKFAPAKEWAGDFGIDGTATNGVYAKGGSNVPDVDVSGFYMVVVNLLDETIEINAPNIYGIGDAFGGYNVAAAANIFTIDNTVPSATSPACVANGALRMHVAASTLTNTSGDPIEWWAGEVNLFGGDIVYREAGGDPALYEMIAGEKVVLDFKAGTGTAQ